MDINKSTTPELALEVEQQHQEKEGSEWKGTFCGYRVNKGGWKTGPFIFGNEICEKLGAIGLQVNLVTYLTQQLHFNAADAANVLTNFGGTASFTPLIGAIIADAFLGRYWVVLIGSILYTLGSFILTFQAAVPSLRPAQCPLESSDCEHPSMKHVGILYLVFFCLATGSGGIRPCVAAFGADQFNEEDPKQRDQIRHFFNWYYFSMQVAILITSTVFVYIQDNVGWVVGFGIPAILMFLSIFTFVLGAPIYRMTKPTGSPLTRLIQVLSAAMRKRNMKTPEDPEELYGAKANQDSITKLVHTDQFRFLDKAAIVTDDDRESMREGKNNSSSDNWRLCTVQSVEELKILIRMMPIWLTSILVFTAWSQSHSFWVLQGRTMDRKIIPGSKFEIPPGSMGAFTTIALLISVPVYDKLGIPLLRRFTGNPRGITCLQRIGTGLFLSMFTMISAALVEVKRKQVATDAGINLKNYGANDMIPISIFWMLPQYLVVGFVELFLFIGHLEFFYDQSPDSMRSMSAGVFWIMIAAGSYTSTLLVTLLQKYSEWLPSNSKKISNINQGRLENMYWLLTAILFANFCLFLVCAKWYRYKKWNEAVAEEEKENTTTQPMH